MLIAALILSVKTRKQSNFSLIGKWINNTWYIIRNAKTWVNLEDILNKMARQKNYMMNNSSYMKVLEKVNFQKMKSDYLSRTGNGQSDCKQQSELFIVMEMIYN